MIDEQSSASGHDYASNRSAIGLASNFEEDTALNVRVGWVRKNAILPLGSCTCLFMSNCTPLLLFGVMLS